MHYPRTQINSQDIIFKALINACCNRFSSASPEDISKIFRENGLPVSATTIRSIFKAVDEDISKNFRYYLADNFALYLGYSDFIDFAKNYCETNHLPYSQTGQQFTVTESDQTSSKRTDETTIQADNKFLPKYYYWLSSVFMALVLAWFGVYFLELGVSPTLSASPQAIGNPTTVFFKYRFPYYWKLLGYDVGIYVGIANFQDSIIKLPPHRTDTIFTFKQIGYHRPFLTLNGKKIGKPTPVYLTSDKWECFSKLNFQSLTQYAYELYNQDSLLKYKKRLQLAPNFYLNYRYFHPNIFFPLNNFTLEYTIRSEPTGYSDWICRDIWLAIVADNGKHINLNFTQTGNNCEIWPVLMTADTLINKETESTRINQTPSINRVKNLTGNFDSWKTITLKSSNNQLIIYYEQKPVYYLNNSRLSGKIMGMNIAFRGQGGAIKCVRIWNKDKDILLFPTSIKNNQKGLVLGNHEALPHDSY